MADSFPTPIEIGLTAAIVAVEADEPQILVSGDAGSEVRAGLPFGTFDPVAHRTFEIGLRAWVTAQTALTVGYVEQLYTFGDRGRHARPGDTGAHVVSVGYLALTQMSHNAALRAAGAGFEPWYRFFPLRTGAAAGPKSSTPPSYRCLSNGRGPVATIRLGRPVAASGCATASAPAVRPGMRRRCLIDTSFSTRPDLSRKRGATAARRWLRVRRFRRLANRCGSIIAAS